MTRARQNANLLAQTATGNINLSGVLTATSSVNVGTGGTAGRVQVGTGSTIHGSGNVSIAGTLYAFDVVLPLKIDGFNPSNGAENVSASSDIRISFNKSIGIGSTGYVRIKQNNTITDTFGVGSTYISRADLNKTLVITPSNPLNKVPIGAANTVTTIVAATFIDDPNFTGINTTGSNITYTFKTENVSLGDATEGGYLICNSGGVQWIVAPNTSEVSRNWYSQNDANIRAQAVSGCTGWFVPSQGQLQNPGYTCRTYWDSYSLTSYWSTNAPGFKYARAVSLVNGTFGDAEQTSVLCIRSFRCVTF